MRNVFAQQKGEDEKLCFAQNMFGLLTSKTIPFYFYFFGLKTSTTWKKKRKTERKLKLIILKESRAARPFLS